MKNELTFKPYDGDRHFELISEWAKSRGFPAPNPKFLPPTGILMEFAGEPIAGGFLFKTDANIACIAHLFSNPRAPEKPRREAVEQAINFLARIAYTMGFEMVTVSTNIASLGARFEKLGFERTDDEVSHFRRVLCQ